MSSFHYRLFPSDCTLERTVILDVTDEKSEEIYGEMIHDVFQMSSFFLPNLSLQIINVHKVTGFNTVHKKPTMELLIWHAGSWVLAWFLLL